jgi:uncharacterized protein YdaU (DUF1376 family)
MHYYKFNIGDYASHTGYLSLLEDLAYRRLLDHYYLQEKPIPNDPDKVARLIGMRDHSAEGQILADFFTLENNEWINKRADEIITEYHANADRARANGAKGGRPKKPRDNPAGSTGKPNPNPEETGSKAKHKTLTTKQKPLTNNHKTVSIDNNLSDKADAIFNYWVGVMGKSNTAKFITKRERAVKARLKEGYSVDDIKLAIDGCKRSPWHQGQNNDHKVFDDLELICRDGAKLESFINQPASISTQSRTLAGNMQAAKDFIGDYNG